MNIDAEHLNLILIEERKNTLAMIKRYVSFYARLERSDLNYYDKRAERAIFGVDVEDKYLRGEPLDEFRDLV